MRSRDPSSQLCDLRSRRLMHGGMFLVGDPGLLVHKGQPPAGKRGACEMVEPRDRAIVEG